MQRMGESMRVVRALGLSALVWAVATLGVFGAVEVYPVNQVQRGITGVGYTVVEGTAIEPFSVEVLGVLEKAGPSGSLILVRAYGELIDRVGGIASGMSGSPVYVDGKLLGAIGYGFQMADHRIALVTPAADMLEVMDLIDAEQPQELEGIPKRGETVALPAGVVVADSVQQARELIAALPDDVWVAAPVSTPLMVGGFGSRAMGRLRHLFADYDVEPMQAGGAMSAPGIEAPLEPGAALGVQLVRGDVDVTAIGTLTAVDGDRFVGFGHQFLGRGEVDHFVTRAYIYHTVSSVAFPFKIGAPLDAVGRLLQDRGAGIAGVLGREPDRLTLTMRVADRDRRVDQRFRVEIARDRELTVPLLIVSALEGVDRAMDRLGPGTSRVNFRIDGAGMPRALVRENVFYSDSDIAAASLSELLVASELLHNNEFQDPVIQEVAVDIELDSIRKTARIERAEPATRRVRQGETVDVVVTLRPYRQPAFEVTVPLEIPADAGRGPVTVSVRGGTFWGSAIPDVADNWMLPPTDQGDDGDDGAVSLQAESLEKLIDEFEKEPKNNEVVVEFYPPSFFDGGRSLFGGRDNQADPADEEEEAESAEEAGETGTVVEGDVAEADQTGDDDESGEPSHEPEADAEGTKDTEAEGVGEADESGADAEAVDEEPTDPSEYKPIRATYPTAFVVHGEVQFPLTILPAREPEEEDGEQEKKEPPSAPSSDRFKEPGVLPIQSQ